MSPCVEVFLSRASFRAWSRRVSSSACFCLCFVNSFAFSSALWTSLRCSAITCIRGSTSRSSRSRSTSFSMSAASLQQPFRLLASVAGRRPAGLADRPTPAPAPPARAAAPPRPAPAPAPLRASRMRSSASASSSGSTIGTASSRFFRLFQLAFQRLALFVGRSCAAVRSAPDPRCRPAPRGGPPAWSRAAFPPCPATAAPTT